MVRKKVLIIVIIAALAICLILAVLPISLPIIPPADAPYLPLYKETGNSPPGGVSLRVIEGEVSLELQLLTLYELGFSPKNEMRDLYEKGLTENGWPEWVLERYPYWLVFTALGWEYEDDKGNLVPYSDKTYCFRTWDNLTPESYVHTLSQIARLSHDEISLENIQSGRTKIFRRLWVSYSLDGELFKWSVHDDPFTNPNQIYNPGIIDAISKFSLNDAYENNLYWIHDEQGFHLVYTTEAKLLELYGATGINFFGPDDNQILLF